MTQYILFYWAMEVGVLISLVVAADKNGVIGKDNKLPWKLPNDLAYFKSLTLGNRVLMGRNTYNSIGHPLDGRDNIVVTSKPLDYPEGSRITLRNNLINTLLEFGNNNAELFVIGGASVYEQALPYATRIYLTRINEEFDGDTYFNFNEDEFKLVTRVRGRKDDNNPYSYHYLVYERK